MTKFNSVDRPGLPLKEKKHRHLHAAPEDREDETETEWRERDVELGGQFDLANGRVLTITPTKSHVFEFTLHEGSASGPIIGSLEIPKISMAKIWTGMATQIIKTRAGKL